MKRLTLEAETIATTASSQELEHSMSVRGLTTMAGNLKPRTQTLPTIEYQSQATHIRSMMRRSLRSKAYEYEMVDGQLVKTEMPPLTEQELAQAREHMRPASIDQIISHLQRLAMHKRMDSQDPQRNAYIFADYAQRLEGVTELEVFSAVDYFIERDNRDEKVRAFFPDFATLNKWLKENFKDCEWSKYN